MKVKILHLYYDIMNLYGEYGNVVALKRHLIQQGFEVEVEYSSLNDEKKFDVYDVIYMGCGTELNQIAVLKDLYKDAKSLKEAIDKGTVAIFTGNSFELLGSKIDDHDGLNILNFQTQKGDRIISDVICTSKILDKKVVGFINTSGHVSSNDNSLFDVEWGANAKKDGISYKNLIGTHIIGPLLIKNPEVLKYIVNKICIAKGTIYEEKNEDYLYEERAYDIVLKELENRKMQERV